MKKHTYKTYDEYKQIQIAGNKEKLKYTWAREENIKILAEFINNKLGDINIGLCHGSRRGNEQKWFMDYLDPCPVVFGTEISNTGKYFNNTLIHDFNLPIPEFTGNCDFVYSNAQDHAYDIQRTLSVWCEQLRIGGYLILEHSDCHTSEHANELDTYGFDNDQEYILTVNSLKNVKMNFITTLDAPDKRGCNFLYYLIWERVS